MSVPQAYQDSTRKKYGETVVDGAYLEKLQDYDAVSQAAAMANWKLDKNGLPLIPQPTSRKDDPLVGSNAYSCPPSCYNYQFLD